MPAHSYQCSYCKNYIDRHEPVAVSRDSDGVHFFHKEDCQDSYEKEQRLKQAKLSTSTECQR